MPTDEEKIERIDTSVKEIENELGRFFKKYDLKLKKKSERGIILGNDLYDLNFMYWKERYFWFIFQGLQINFQNQKYSFRDVINFMQKERQSDSIDTYQILKAFSTYETYLESHLIPFLNMDNNIEKMDAYLKKSPWNK